MTKSTGIDTIPSRLLKASASTTCSTLTHIFNRSIISANVPKEWKTARVTPMFKDGDRTEVGNYRPISILPVVMKILERAIHNKLYSYLTENNLLSPVQSSLRKKYSTLTTLIDISDCILKDVEEGTGTGVLFLDLKKAFDTVNHSLLIKMLGMYRVGNSSLKWFKNYLSDREHIRLGTHKGRGTSWSILGPLMFILYINDLPRVVKKCKVALYADDTALYISCNEQIKRHSSETTEQGM